MNDALATAATLPFRILESLNIPGGYERSFKLAPGGIQANRYLLGFEASAIPGERWPDIFRQLNMPSNLARDFLDSLPEANTALFGFEARPDGESLYKLYLEFWSKLQQRQQHTPHDRSRQLLHLGFKWQAVSPEHHACTYYHCLPGLSVEDIRQRIPDHFSGFTNSPCQTVTFTILDQIEHAQSTDDYLYLEISEPDSNRVSFDLNLYPAQRSVNDIREGLLSIASSMNIDPQKIQRMLSLAGDQPLGHISSGRGRDGREYFTVYYEQQNT